MTWKFRATISTGEAFVLRFYPPGREEVVEYEPDLLRRCAAAGIPVPHIEADSRTGPMAPHPYILYRLIEGEALAELWPTMSAAARIGVAEQVVEYLYRMSTIAVQGYGDLLNAQQARYDSWYTFLHRSIEEGIETAAQYGILSQGLFADVASILDALKRLVPGFNGGLVWGDVSPTNILVDRSGQLMGLLDFEGALAGDVVLNLGYCFASRYTSEFYRTIRSAWGAPTSDELCTRIELYAVLRGMRITKYAHNRNLPTGQPRMPIEELLPGFVVAASRLREKIRPEN